MHRLIKIIVLIFIFILTLTRSVSAQTTSSPYSVFGLGYLEGNSLGPSKAMGGTGIAFLSDRAINLLNPASYSGMDSLVSIFELGLFGKYTTFKSKEDNQAQLNANLKYVVMGFRLTPWLATSFGFAPYSSVGYNINTTAFVEGTSQKYAKTFTGEGGVNQVYLGASVKLIKNLSFGVNAAYLFGNITSTESAEQYYYNLQNVTYLSNFILDYGLNYRFALKNWNYSIGLTYGSEKALNTNNLTTIQTASQSETIKGRSQKYSIPQHFGAGIAFGKEFFRAGIDFERSQWGDISFANPLLRTRNSNRYSFGFEFPSQGLTKGTSRMVFYRFGAEYRDSYLIIDNTPINYRAVSLGAGMPLKGAISVINMSLELGQNGTVTKGLFRETFVTLHIDMSLRALWFMPRKYE
ncbi:MAG: hypothetical protein WAL29_14125 [Bacteroidales bacterium]